MLFKRVFRGILSTIAGRTRLCSNSWFLEGVLIELKMKVEELQVSGLELRFIYFPSL